MTKDFPGRGSDQFALRMPDGMRDRIKTAAADNNRSMNAEIISTLEGIYPAPVIATIDSVSVLLRELAKNTESVDDQMKIMDAVKVLNDEIKAGGIMGTEIVVEFPDRIGDE